MRVIQEKQPTPVVCPTAHESNYKVSYQFAVVVKKVMGDQRYLDQLDTYIEENSNASFSHGICPECPYDLYGEEDWYRNKEK